MTRESCQLLKRLSLFFFHAHRIRGSLSEKPTQVNSHGAKCTSWLQICLQSIQGVQLFHSINISPIWLTDTGYRSDRWHCICHPHRTEEQTLNSPQLAVEPNQGCLLAGCKLCPPYMCKMESNYERLCPHQEP